MITEIDKKLENLELLTPLLCCNKIGKAEIKKENDYWYIVSYCKHHNKSFKQIMWKNEIGFSFMSDNLSAKYPQFLLEVKQPVHQISERNIRHLSDMKNIIFVLTQRCNSSCKICSDKDELSRGELSIDYLKNKLKLFKNKHIYAFGGEPTVRKDLPYIIKLIRKSSNIPCLFTNGLKLSDINYLNELINCGLGFVHLTFDGFNQEIYEAIRGGRHEYKLKLDALENLRIKKTPTVIHCTILRNFNEDQLNNIIRYACKNEFIYDIIVRPLYLCDAARQSGFNRNHILSTQEINSLICQAVDLPFQYFQDFYEAKIKIRNLLKKLIPFSRLNVPFSDQLILNRNNLKPLLNLEELCNIKSNLDILSLIKRKDIRSLIYCLFRNRFDFSLLEYDLAQQGKILKITTYPYKPTVFAGNNCNPCLTELWFTPDNIPIAYGP